MAKKISARQKALKAHAAVVAERAEKDKRVLAAATNWFTADEQIEALNAQLDAQVLVKAAAVSALCDDEGLTLAEAAQLLEADVKEVGALRKRQQDQQPAVGTKPVPEAIATDEGDVGHGERGAA